MNKEILDNCTICPRNCGVNRNVGQVGFCGATQQIEISCATLHRWEEPSISGVNGSGTIFFTHCNLQCVFCQNRQISREKSKGRAVSSTELAEIMLDLQEKGAHNINFVSATHYVPQIVEAIKLAKMLGLKVPLVYNTSAYEKPETLALLSGIIDVYLPDFKYYSTYYAKMYSGIADYPDVAKEAIAEMIAQTGAVKFDENGIIMQGTIIRHLMLPSLSGDTAQVLRYIAEHWLEVAYTSLMRQYTPLEMEKYPEINRTITDAEYEDAVTYFRDLGLVGYLQDGEAVGESFIPNFS